MAEENLENKEEIKPASWVKMKPAELESKVVELAKEGKAPAEIGMILRDRFGIPKTKLFGKRINQILKEKNISIKSEKEITDEKIVHLKEHIVKNKKDYPAARSLTKMLWNLHGIEKALEH